MSGKCNGCENGFDGSGGNGYQPCACKSVSDESASSEGAEGVAVKAGLQLDLYLGQRVTDGEVTGVVRSLQFDQDDVIDALVLLDEPHVLPAIEGHDEITLYTQLLPAHKLRSAPEAGEFGVIAGKWDGNERNCKYASDFASLDEAIAAYDTMVSYPWAYIQYKGRVLELFRKDFEVFV